MAEQPKPEQEFRFEPLGSQHDRAAFSCGKERLDTYLQRQATQDVKKRAAIVFVMTADGKAIAAYYSLSQYSVRLDDVPEELTKKLSKYPSVPTSLIGRFAINKALQGQKLGTLQLMNALHRCLMASEQLASAGVVVDAKDEDAVAFYKKFGFIELPKIERRLFLPMGSIEKMFA